VFKVWRVKGGQRMRKTIGMLFLIGCVSYFLPALSAQQPVQVRGMVEDANGTPVSQAAVKLTSASGNSTLKRATDDTGHFVFSGVAAGDYLLTVKMEGFEKAELGLKVSTSVPPVQRIRLKVATAKEEIIVSPQSDDPISPEQNATAVRMYGELLRSLPAQNESPLVFASLFVDAAANDTEGTKIVVDGVEGNTLDVPSSSVKTIAVNSNPYSVEFGRPGKGRIDVTTRGGSLRRFHKRFEFAFRDASMDAHNPFDTAHPPRQREWTAGELDGPLFGGKATFFVGGDYLRDDNNTFVAAVTPSGPLAETLPIPRRTVHLLGRTDIRLTPLHILSLRYNWSKDRLPNQVVGAFDLPEHAWNSNNQTHEIRISETAIPSPAFLNEFRFDFKSRPKLASSVTNAPAILVNGSFNSGGAQISRSDLEKDVEFADLASYLHGKHSLRFGGVLRSRFIDYTDASNFGGTFTFSDLGSFIKKQPVLYTVNLGDPRVTFTQHEVEYFFQDEIRLWPRLSLLVGLRHEFQSNLDNYSNLAPRIALSASTADGRTVLRAGSGIFYQRQPTILEEHFLLLNGSHLRQVVLSNPSFPLVGNPSNLVSNSPPPSVLRTDPRLRSPYVFQASLGLERKLGRQTSLTAEYAMLRGLKLYRMRNVNAPLPTIGLRPDPNFLNVDQFETSGNSNSNSFTLGLRTTVGGRLQILSQYTFSHSIDDTSGLFSLPADNYDLRGERGRSDFDRRHRLNFASVLNLPWNFSLGCIVSLRSGIPFNITTGFDNNHDTVFNDRPSLGNPKAPFNSFAVDGSFIGGTRGVLYDGTQALFSGSFVPVNANSVRWLVLPGAGNVGRNSGAGPGFAEVDLRFAKRFVLREKSKGSRDVELRADAFNLPNHVNYIHYVGTLTSQFFGRPNDAYAPREIQLSVRLRF
jgi:Carboxypeptidase regulatory-like domain/TonB dependent receptor